MADLITLDDYEQAGGDVDQLVVAFAISAASDVVRGYLNQTISLVANDVVTLAGTGSRALILPELPVVSLNAIYSVGSSASALVPAADYREERGIVWRLSPTEVDDGEVLTSVWTYGLNFVVDYTHGWATIPADIKLVTARLAMAIAADSTVVSGIRQEAIQDYSYTRANASESTAAELAVLSRRVVRQVPVA